MQMKNFWEIWYWIKDTLIKTARGKKGKPDIGFKNWKHTWTIGKSRQEAAQKMLYMITAKSISQDIP